MISIIIAYKPEFMRMPNDQVRHADLIALKDTQGLYTIVKSRRLVPPRHRIRKTTLRRYVAESLAQL